MSLHRPVSSITLNKCIIQVTCFTRDTLYIPFAAEGLNASATNSIDYGCQWSPDASGDRLLNDFCLRTLAIATVNLCNSQNQIFYRPNNYKYSSNSFCQRIKPLHTLQEDSVPNVNNFQWCRSSSREEKLFDGFLERRCRDSRTIGVFSYALVRKTRYKETKL